MVAVVRVSTKTKKLLEGMKIFENESYEDIILELIEDHLRVNPKFREELKKAAKEVKEGKTVPLSKIIEKLNKNSKK